MPPFSATARPPDAAAAGPTLRAVELLVVLAVVFFALIVIAPQQIIQLGLVLVWGLMALSALAAVARLLWSLL